MKIVICQAFSNISITFGPTSLYRKRNVVKIGFCEIRLYWANLLFAFVAIAGKVVENVSLPLWIDSVNGNHSGKSVDSYFVLSFASLSFVIIFGLGTLFIKIFSPQVVGETEKRFPHLLLFFVGFCHALSGALVVFANPRFSYVFILRHIITSERHSDDANKLSETPQYYRVT